MKTKKVYEKEELTEAELSSKYGDIESKIPSFWATWEDAGVNLAQDLSFGHWDIRDNELYRVISLVSIRVQSIKITQHLDPKFSFQGLYPEIMKPLGIEPDGYQIGELSLMYASSGVGKSRYTSEYPSIEDTAKLIADRDEAEKKEKENGDFVPVIVDHMSLLNPDRAKEVTKAGQKNLRKISEIMAEFIADLKAKGNQIIIVPKGIGKLKEKKIEDETS
jgi:hypothetical protein